MWSWNPGSPGFWISEMIPLDHRDRGNRADPFTEPNSCFSDSSDSLNSLHSLEFFCNLLFSAKSWQNSASLDGKKQNKNPQLELNTQPPDLHSNTLPTELDSKLLGRRVLKWALFVSCTTSHVELHFTCWLFLESIEHDFLRFRFRLATECWLSSVGRVLEWRSGGCGFNPDWGQFFILLLAGRILPGFGRK